MHTIKCKPAPPGKSARYTILGWLDLLLRYGVLILFAVLCVIPLFWVLATSLKTTADIAQNPLGFPGALHWDNYVRAWVQGRFSQYFLNSIYTSIPIVLGTVGLAC